MSESSERPLAFLDFETTGLDVTDEPWEVGVIVRRSGEPDVEHHAFIEHHPWKANRLPGKFLADLRDRYVKAEAVPPWIAAGWMHPMLEGATVIGACPWFDAGHVSRLYAAADLKPNWQHRLRCVESLAVGFFGRDVGGLGDVAKALGIETPAAHTALGDARTARDCWDLMATARDTAEVLADRESA